MQGKLLIANGVFSPQGIVKILAFDQNINYILAEIRVYRVTGNIKQYCENICKMLGNLCSEFCRDENKSAKICLVAA